MKKFLIVVAISALHINFAHGMLGDAAKAIVHYAAKYMDPEAYVLDAQNKEFYQLMSNEISSKNISTLRITQFPDHNGTMQTFEYTFARKAERQKKTSDCIMQHSLIQDPIKKKDAMLFEILRVNWQNITILDFELALKALQEQKNEKVPVHNTGCLMRDVLLTINDFLPESAQFLLKSERQKDVQQITLDQQRKTTEAYLLSLSLDEQEKLLQEVSQKKVISTGIISSPKQILTSGVSKSPSNNSGAISNSLGSENADIFPYNPFENEKEVTNKNNKV